MSPSNSNHSPTRRKLPRELFDANAFTSQMWFLLFLYGGGATLILLSALIALRQRYLFYIQFHFLQVFFVGYFYMF